MFWYKKCNSSYFLYKPKITILAITLFSIQKQNEAGDLFWKIGNFFEKSHSTENNPSNLKSFVKTPLIYFVIWRNFVKFWHSAGNSDFDRIEKKTTKSHYNGRVLFHKAPTKKVV